MAMRHRLRALFVSLALTLGPLAAAHAEGGADGDPLGGFGTDETTNRVRAAVIRPIGAPPTAEKPDHEADVRREFPDLQRVRTIKWGYASGYTAEGKPVVLEKRLFNDGWSVMKESGLWCMADLFRDRRGIEGTVKLGDGTGQGLPTLSASGKSVRFHIVPAKGGRALNYLMSYAGKEGLEFRRDKTKVVRLPRK